MRSRGRGTGCRCRPLHASMMSTSHKGRTQRDTSPSRLTSTIARIVLALSRAFLLPKAELRRISGAQNLARQFWTAAGVAQPPLCVAPTPAPPAPPPPRKRCMSAAQRERRSVVEAKHQRAAVDWLKEQKKQHAGPPHPALSCRLSDAPAAFAMHVVLLAAAVAAMVVVMLLAAAAAVAVVRGG